ncbi:MAG: NDP-sugar synthase [Gammaproteobacteria bacterium]|nr:NDP-sugar synthase [Gammaproteobacteria bacterium]MBT8105147.1 NDP-sugar synthase [Gammaproteobacteria bacterium]NNK25161.1 NDP-sugar synthase [Woeseiaceae bacterium]
MQTKDISPVPPIAVIGFSDQSSPLEPLWPSTHRALIPLAGKSLIVYLIEQLADAGIRHIRIAGSIQQFAVRNRLRCGREWGITIRYSDLHGEELLAECLASEGSCLYLQGDHLYDADFSRLVANASRYDLPADIEANCAGLWRVQNGKLSGHSLGVAGGTMSYENALSNVLDYHRANLRAVQGFLPHLNVPGAALHRAAIADWQSDIAPTASVGTNVFIGKHCRVGRLARLDADCVLSNGVVLEDGVCLENVSVLPNCFVGRQASIRDAILGPDGMLSFDGTFQPVNNRRFLGPTRDNQEQWTGLPDRHVASRTASGSR